MLLLVGTVLGFLLAGSAFLVVRGLVGVFRRRPKAALAALGGVGLFIVVVILLGTASFLLGPSTEAADFSTEKARVLSKNISALMNLSFLGLPFGTFAGIVAEIRTRRPSNSRARRCIFVLRGCMSRFDSRGRSGSVKFGTDYPYAVAAVDRPQTAARSLTEFARSKVYSQLDPFMFNPKPKTRWKRPKDAFLLAGVTAVFLFVAICSCATTKEKVGIAPPPDPDSACDGDADCQIADRPFINCCEPCRVQPYAISKLAVSRHESECRDANCKAIGCKQPDLAPPGDFVAICVRHTCEQRAKRWWWISR